MSDQLKINKRPKDDSEETKGDDDELKKWFDETLQLPQYYQLFKEAGCENIDYLYHFDFDNGDQELIEIGIKKKVHRRMILSKINTRPGDNRDDELKRWFNETLELPQYYDLFRNSGYENIKYLYQFDIENGNQDLMDIGIKKKIHRRMILSEIKEICAGKIDNYLAGNNKIDMVQDLNDKRKAELFGPPRRLLYGRTITIRTNQIKSSRYKLFELKDVHDDSKWDISDIVTPKTGKKTDVHSSYSSLRQSMAKGSYINASVC